MRREGNKMKDLAICIPNYNRIDKLKRLIDEVSNQIINYTLMDKVEICISDDCSPQDPSELIDLMMKKYPDISFCYVRNKKNEGMDYNFLNSVLISNSLYCWIIGNDDIPTCDGIKTVVEYVKSNENVDFIVTPFDVHDNEDKVISRIYPLSNKSDAIYDCANWDDRKKLFMNVQGNSGIFAFLSSVVFRRELWINSYKDFTDKMQSIFIQVYLNLNAICNGANYHYLSKKIIKNYADPIMNDTVDRMSRILFGLDDVVEFFFEDDIKLHMKKVITDGCINGWIWSLPNDSEVKKKLLTIDSPKNNFYKKYYIDNVRLMDSLGCKKIIIYGAGDFGQRSLDKIINKGLNINGVVDGSKDKIGKEWNGYVIMSMSDLLTIYNPNDYFVIVGSHEYLTEIIENLEKNQIFQIGIVC